MMDLNDFPYSEQQLEKKIRDQNVLEYFNKELEYENTSPARSLLHKIRKEKIEELTKNLSGDVAVDIGCGKAETLSKLNYKQLIGIDVADKALRESPENVRRIEGDIRKIPLEDEISDLTLCIGVIEYIKEKEKAIKELSRITKLNKILIISFVKKYTPAFFMRYYMRYFTKKPIIQNTHTYNSLKKLLMKNGFMPVKKTTVFNTLYIIEAIKCRS